MDEEMPQLVTELNLVAVQRIRQRPIYALGFFQSEHVKLWDKCESTNVRVFRSGIYRVVCG